MFTPCPNCGESCVRPQDCVCRLRPKSAPKRPKPHPHTVAVLRLAATLYHNGDAQ